MGLLDEYQQKQKNIAQKIKNRNLLEEQVAAAGGRLLAPVEKVTQLDNLYEEIEGDKSAAFALMQTFWDALNRLYAASSDEELSRLNIPIRLICQYDQSIYTLDRFAERVYQRRACYVIKGPIGCGKTDLCNELASKLRTIYGDAIPIVIRLQDMAFDVTGVEHTLINFLAKELSFDDADASALLRDARTILLLDGLDELSLANRDQSYYLLRRYIANSRCATILTARPIGNTAFVMPNNRFEILPLEREVVYDNLAKTDVLKRMRRYIRSPREPIMMRGRFAAQLNLSAQPITISTAESYLRTKDLEEFLFKEIADMLNTPLLLRAALLHLEGQDDEIMMEPSRHRQVYIRRRNNFDSRHLPQRCFSLYLRRSAFLIKRLFNALLRKLFEHNSKFLAALDTRTDVASIEELVRRVAFEGQLQQLLRSGEGRSIANWAIEIGLFKQVGVNLEFKNRLLQLYFIATYLSDRFYAPGLSPNHEFQNLLNHSASGTALFLFPEEL